MKSLTAILISLSFFFVFTRCVERTPVSKVSPAFYHWKTELKLTERERALLDSLQVRQMFVRFFDVDWSEELQIPIPLAVLQADTTGLQGMEIIPVVFITNRTFEKVRAEEIDTLVARIYRKINELASELPGGQVVPNSIQFDCDWTQSTRGKYFDFLIKYRRLLNSMKPTDDPPLLSVTLRLHQLKYPEQTGVPPVDRATLMFYNTGDIDNWDTQNSILDLKTAALYLPPSGAMAKARYPLPLDVALPIFKWGVIYRDGQLWKLFNNLDAKFLNDAAKFRKLFTSETTGRYEVIKDTWLEGHYLVPGDLIRLESVSMTVLEEAAGLLHDRIFKFATFGDGSHGEEFHLVFYHLDSTLLTSFPHERLNRVLEKFKP